MEEKYINLLLNKCVDFTSGILFITYNKEISNFIDKLCVKAKTLGIKEIYKEEIDPYETHEILKNSTIEEIKTKYQGKTIAIVAHRAPQLALEVITKNISWEEAIANDWRNTGDWQPGWEYIIK